MGDAKRNGVVCGSSIPSFAAAPALITIVVTAIQLPLPLVVLTFRYQSTFGTIDLARDTAVIVVTVTHDAPYPEASTSLTGDDRLASVAGRWGV